MESFDLKAARDPVGDGPEVLEASVAPSSPPCELELAVDGFDGGGGGVVFEVSEDALEVAAEASPKGDEWRHPRAAAPAYDGFEMIAGVGFITVVPSVCEEVSDGERAGDFRVLAADVFTQCDLLRFEVLHVPAKRPERATRQAPGLAGDLLADGVEGLAAELHDVEAIEADPRVGKVFAGSGDESFRHVDGNFLDPGGGDAAPGEFGGELPKSGAVLARGEEEQACDLGSTATARGFLSVDFKECGAVSVAFSSGGLIDAETFERTPVGFFPNLLDAAADEVPDAILADRALSGDFGDWQNFGEGEQVGFHEQGESALRPGPGEFSVTDLTLGSPDARDAGAQGGAVLEKMEVLPGALDSVMHRAGLPRLRVGEAASRLEVDDQFEGLRLGVEISGNDLPWGGESERLGKEMFDSHGRNFRCCDARNRGKTGRSGLVRAPESCPQEPAAPTSIHRAHSRGGTLWTTFLQGASALVRSSLKPPDSDTRYPLNSQMSQKRAPLFPSQEKTGLITGDDLLSQDLSSHYHRRKRVSLPGSEWDRVVPLCYGHQRS